MHIQVLKDECKTKTTREIYSFHFITQTKRKTKQYSNEYVLLKPIDGSTGVKQIDECFIHIFEPQKRTLYTTGLILRI